jgi:hypothetical protein
MSQKKYSTADIRSQHLSQWRKSGQRQRHYCQQEQIALPTFTNWLRQERKIVNNGGSKVGNFIELHSSPVEEVGCKGIEIHSPSGYRIQIPLGTSIEFIKALLS